MSLTAPVTERDHIQGPPSAPVTLVEYGDYECPHCGQAYSIVKAIQKQLGDDLRFVYRNFPLSQMHPYAEHAAEAAEAAGAQGRFWEMHDTLFEHQEALDDPDLVDYAGAIGLDTGRFVHDMEQGVFAGRVEEDFLSGVRSGVNGTPTFFINGVRHDSGYDYETLLPALENARRT